MSAAVPLPIPRGRSQRSQSGTPLGTSPASVTKGSSAAEARQLFKRLQYDEHLDASAWQVGFVETEALGRRPSGAEAWSLRLRDRVVELPYLEFAERFSPDVPFHRIAFFRDRGAVVWESEAHRSKLHAGEEALSGGSWHGAPAGSSWQPASLGGSSITGVSGQSLHGPSPLQPQVGPRLGASGGAGPSTSPSFGPAPPPSFGFSRQPSGSSPPPPQRTQQRERPARGGVASLLAAASERVAAEAGPGSPDGPTPLGRSPPGGMRRLHSGASTGREADGGSPAAPAGSFTGGAPPAPWRFLDRAASAAPSAGVPSSAPPGGWCAAGRPGSCGSSARDAPLTPTPPGAARWRPCSSSLGGCSPGAEVPRGLSGVLEGGESSDRVAGSSADEAYGWDSELEDQMEWDDPAAAAAECGGGGGDDAAAVLADGLEEDEQRQQQEEQGEEGEEGGPVEPPRDFSELPEPVWLSVLGGLGVRDLCYAARANRGLRALSTGTAALWGALYEQLHGDPAPAGWPVPAVRRACRRSALRAARWLEAAAPRAAGGFPWTTCIALDGTKAVSGDGSCVRVWSHGSGRRIATLPGHPGRLTGVAFDDDTLVSGCTGGVVRLWSMDELRCNRSLRHHGGAVSAVALLHGVPVSAGEEGEIAVWDAAAAAGGGGAPIVSMFADGPVAALEGSPQSGHLLSAGWDVDGWDMATAQRIFSLVPPPRGGDEGAAEAAGGGGGFSCVASGGPLVAAGRAGEVVLWDVRSARAVGTVPYIPAAVAAAASGAAAAAAGAPAAGCPKSASPRVPEGSGGSFSRDAWEGAAPPCVGVQLDDWKLVTGWAPGRALCVYDVRSLGGGSPRAGWCEPAMVLDAPARVTCFRFHEQTLIAGQEGAECALWSFVPPPPPGAAGGLLGSPAGALGAADAGAGAEDGAAEGGRGRRKDKKGTPARADKKDKGSAAPKRGRYPKRGTR